jgi:hypothetical protein
MAQQQQIAEPPPRSKAPYEVSDELRPRIEELGLQDVVDGLREEGYAVIHDAAPPELLDEMREAIHSLATQYPQKPDSIESAPMLLGRHPAIDRVATLPKVLAIAEYSVGKAVRAGRFHGSIMRQGQGPESGGLHSDQNWIPAPFPEHNIMVTFCVACEGMSDEEGATRVVPRSHLERRHPTPDESNGKSVAIEVEKGGIAVWDGAVWHGSGHRTVPGTRTMLHATYQRLYTQPINDFSHLLADEEYMASAAEGIRGLLGADLFFHTDTPTTDVDMEKFGSTSAASKL